MTERVGVVVEGEDKVSGVFKTIGAAGKKTFDVIKAGSKKAGSSFKTLALVVGFLRNAVDLAKRGLEIFQAVVVENVRAMIEYRGEADSVAQKFRDIADEAQYTRAIIADLLTPVILGLTDALNDAGSSVVDYINANRRLIATNIVNYLMDASDILIKGVAVGFTWATRGVSAFMIAINSVATVFNVLVGTIISGTATLIRSFAKVAEKVGKEGLAKSLREAARETQAFGDVFLASAGDNVDVIKKTIAEQKKLEDGIKKVREIALNFTGEARVSMLKWADSWDPVKRKVNETTDAIKHQRDAFDSLRVTAAAYLQRVADLRERDARLLDAQMEARKTKTIEQMVFYTDSAATMINATAAVLSDFDATVQDKLKSLAASTVRIAGQIVADLAKKVILANAATGASSAAAQTMSLGPFAIAAAPAAAAAAFGLIAALIAKLPAFEMGGMMGMGGLASMHAGERIVDADRTKKLNRWIDNLDTIGTARSQTGGGITLNVRADITNPMEMTSAQIKRWLIQIAKEAEELFEDGQFLRNVARA